MREKTENQVYYDYHKWASEHRNFQAWRAPASVDYRADQLNPNNVEYKGDEDEDDPEN